MKRYKKLIEKAYAGNTRGLKIEVWTDHNPPHFHVIKKDNFDVRIKIEDELILSYKWQKSNKKISSVEFLALKRWLKQKSGKHNITNKERIQILWNALSYEK